jgi:hypothetical protein
MAELVPAEKKADDDRNVFYIIQLRSEDEPKTPARVMVGTTSRHVYEILQEHESPDVRVSYWISTPPFPASDTAEIEIAIKEYFVACRETCKQIEDNLFSIELDFLSSAVLNEVDKQIKRVRLKLKRLPSRLDYEKSFVPHPIAPPTFAQNSPSFYRKLHSLLPEDQNLEATAE